MPSNISVFVPHNGCPNMCSFCNQFSITSHICQPTEKDVDDAVDVAVRSMGDGCRQSEIAFFGGSFTAIERGYMISLLESAYKYVRSGTVKGIRLSTRPDAIDAERLDILRSYGVTTIELGAQSMDDEVLFANHRGHTSQDVVDSSRLIKEYGFSLGLQMMTGLYKDTDAGALYTCDRFIELAPDCVRIYPTVVLKNTLLADYCEKGIYTPQTVGQAVEICTKLLGKFAGAGIPVIRLGLHTIEQKDYVAGPWHPAFGELCESRMMYERIAAKVESGKNYIVTVSPRNISKAIGQKRSNIVKFSDNGIGIRVVGDGRLNDRDIKIEEVRTV